MRGVWRDGPPSARLAQGLGAAGFWAGIVVLAMPLAAPFTGEQALVWLKLVHVLGGPLGCLALGVLLLPSAMLLLRRARHLRQAAQDAAAGAILDALRRDPHAAVPRFLLYLRAFETTGRLPAPLFVRLRRASLAATQGVTDDLESHVSLAARGVAPLIALGRPGESIGASRIATADATWQADIDLLIRRARGVLLLPSDRPGTRWEIAQLQAQGWLPKVIFVMPPRTVGDFDSAARWEAARAALAPLGLALPPYDPHGLLFELDAHGQLLQAEPLVPHAPRVMREAMERLLDPDPPARPPEQSLRRARRRGRQAWLLGSAETARQLSPYALALGALWAPGPGPAFDPADSLATAFQRSLTEEPILAARAAQQRALQADPVAWPLARAIAASPAPHPPLVVLGLQSLDDATRLRWLQGRLVMLQRMGTARCAASAEGRIDDDIVLSYLPAAQVRLHVEAETAALLAGLRTLAASRAVAPQAADLSAMRDRLAARLPPAALARIDALNATLAAGGVPDAALRCDAWRSRLTAAVADPVLARAMAAAWAAAAAWPPAPAAGDARRP